MLWEDEHVLVINKPASLVVHSSPELGDRYGDTLINGLLHHCPEISKLTHYDAYFRPGIVQRLDKQTSGAMVVAKTQGP